MRLVIFDFDGLILDTETPDYDSWRDVFQEFGQELPMAEWADGIGTKAGAFDPVACLVQQLGHDLPRHEIEQRRRARFHELVARQPLQPGVVEYLDAAPQLGIQLAVASSATRDWVEGHLDRFGVRGAFACIKTIEDVARAKPAPDLFNAVLAELRIPAEEAIVLEDSPNGILASARAGVYSVAVPNHVTRKLDLSGACLRIDSLPDWPLARLLAHARNGRG
ncbi:MAG: HAD-IA family hydrolase [Candidatus Hydrogenedentes bacterium]|nr:HAD-IA family hydrolase [Candidatus Hydrogenedentota bacterium]